MHEFSSNREMQTYRYGQIETPFLKANQNEDLALGRYAKEMKVWRTVSLISLCISFLLLLLVIVEILSPHIHVLYAEVLQNGFVKQVGWLTTQS